MGKGIIDILNIFNKNKKKDISKEEETNEIKKDISQDEIDKILDKISDSGYKSLSNNEKDKLFNASKK